MTPRLIADRLQHICETESIDAEADALATLARAADGSMRDALSLLDQAIAYCGGNVSEAQVALMLGTIDRGHVLRLLRLLAAGDARGIIDAIREIDEQFPNYERLLEDIARDLQRIAVYQVVGVCDGEEELGSTDYAELADALPMADVQLFYQTAIMGRRDINLAPDPRSGAEMTLLRMLAFRPATTDAAPAPASGGAPSAGTSAKKGRSAAPSAPVQGAPPASAAPQGPAATWSDPEWSQLVTQLGLAGSVRLLASNCALQRRDGTTVYLSLDPRSESLLTKPRKDALARKLTEHFGESLSVDISIGVSAAETPVQQESRLESEAMEAARDELEADPNVQTMKSIFGAKIEPESIRLNDPAQSDQ